MFTLSISTPESVCDLTGVRCVPAVVYFPTDISIIHCGVNDEEK